MKVMKAIATSVTIVSIFLMVYVSQVFALSESDFQIFGRRYGVPPQLLRAISIVESQEGKLTGDYEVRKVVDYTQLKFLRKIARYTGRSLSEFKGSYAGAMGYMQIIPSTFHYYAQDGNGDGIKDPLNPYDSLATAAYFLARKLAQKRNMTEAIRSYNNNSVYCEKVISLYWKLDLKTRFADLLNHFQLRIP